MLPMRIDVSDEHNHCTKDHYESMDVDDEGSDDLEEITWILGEVKRREVKETDYFRHAELDMYEKKHYFRGINAFLNETSNYYAVLDHFRTSPILGYVVRDLASFISSELQCIPKKLKHYGFHFSKETSILLQSMYYFLFNKYTLSVPYIDIVIDTVKFCLINPKSRCNFGKSYCLLLKDIAADIMEVLYDKHSCSKIWNTVFNDLCNVFKNHSSHFLVYYGAIISSLSIGIEAVTEVFPSFIAYCKRKFRKTMRRAVSKENILYNKSLFVWEYCIKCDFLCTCLDTHISQIKFLTNPDPNFPLVAFLNNFWRDELCACFFNLELFKRPHEDNSLSDYLLNDSLLQKMVFLKHVHIKKHEEVLYHKYGVPRGPLILEEKISESLTDFLYKKNIVFTPFGKSTSALHIAEEMAVGALYEIKDIKSSHIRWVPKKTDDDMEESDDFFYGSSSEQHSSIPSLFFHHIIPSVELYDRVWDNIDLSHLSWISSESFDAHMTDISEENEVDFDMYKDVYDSSSKCLISRTMSEFSLNLNLCIREFTWTNLSVYLTR